jgi:tRNA (guanosine-2'-O-)-methyltransferase
VKTTRTIRRVAKVREVLAARQDSLMVVLENIHDPHNVSAIFRTCDAVGVPKVCLVYNMEKFPKIGKKTSASALKWVEKEKYKSIEKCYSELRSNGFRIYASAINHESKNIYELDLTVKAAIVLGNEHRGVSEEAAGAADDTFMIPMFGMVQSLNVSVAGAVILYEALRQRIRKGMYDKSGITNERFLETEEIWLKK